MTLIGKAYNFAQVQHAGQLRDDGKDYFADHIEVVVAILETLDNIPEHVIAAAYLHDVIEDCGVAYEELVDMFGSEVADMVNEVTHEGQADSKGYYFPRLKTKWGIMIKFADRLSNLNSMDAWDEERQAHYLKKSKFWRSE